MKKRRLILDVTMFVFACIGVIGAAGGWSLADRYAQAAGRDAGVVDAGIGVHACCWHDSNIILTSNPAIAVTYCCKCGDRRYSRIGEWPPLDCGAHGAYLTDVRCHLHDAGRP